MKLFYSPTACSLSPHIVLCESGLPYSLVRVDLKTKRTENGVDFLTINDKGQVPTLKLDDETILTEGVAIVQYIADQVPASNLLAPVGQIERYQTVAWLNFISAELHKSFGPLFHLASEEAKKAAGQTLSKHFHYVDSHLEKRDFLVGEHFTVADAYLFTVLTWRQAIPNLPRFINLERYIETLSKRPAIERALREEA